MTRTVADAALMMAVLSRPDCARRTSLPCQEIAWTRLDAATVKGLRIGLQLDAGWGLAVEPAVARGRHRRGAGAAKAPARSSSRSGRS